MEITYDYYRIFYYVAMYKSFSKAAKVLMSNQPNITHFMNNLENQLGCKLFVRSNRGVTLTAEGEKLYQHVSVAYQHLHAAEAELAMERSMESGSITISASEIALHLLLLHVVILSAYLHFLYYFFVCLLLVKQNKVPLINIESAGSKVKPAHTVLFTYLIYIFYIGMCNILNII